MKEFAKHFYKSKTWQRCRQAFIAERIIIDGGLCQRCYTAPGYIVHHKVHLTPKNINNPNITLNHSNLEYVCHDCHNDEHFGSRMKTQIGADGRVIPPPL